MYRARIYLFHSRHLDMSARTVVASWPSLYYVSDLCARQGRPETLQEMRTMRRVVDFMTRADRAAQGGPPPPTAAAAACENLGVLDMSL